MRRIIRAFTGEEYPPFVKPEILAALKGYNKYLMIVCDTFHDYQGIGFDSDSNYLPECDYPVYIKDDVELEEQNEHFDGKNMQRVAAIYQLRE